MHYDALYILQYDEGGKDEEYASLWEEQIEGRKYDVSINSIIIGQQGVTARHTPRENPRVVSSQWRSLPHYSDGWTRF